MRRSPLAAVSYKPGPGISFQRPVRFPVDVCTDYVFGILRDVLILYYLLCDSASDGIATVWMFMAAIIHLYFSS